MLNLLLLITFSLVIVPPTILGFASTEVFLQNLQFDNADFLISLLTLQPYTWPFVAIPLLTGSIIAPGPYLLRNLFSWIGLLGLVAYFALLLHNSFNDYHYGKFYFWIALVTGTPFILVTLLKIRQLTAALLPLPKMPSP